MRQLSFQVGAAWLCVCCVLPSFEGIDRLPESAGGTAGTAGADGGGMGNLGGNDSNTPEGGDISPGSAGGDSGRPASSGSGGAESAGGNEDGGTSGGGGGAGTDSGGTAGAAAGTAGGGGTSSAGTAGATGMAGTGGTPSAGCSKYCQGADSVLTICGDYSPPAKIDTEPKCFATCAKAAAADVTCWNTHVANAKASTGTRDVHCGHAFGMSLCGPLP
jgi:hypothetical protein